MITHCLFREISRIALFLLLVSALFSCKRTTGPDWPDITNESRPWTRWWWHGSAVTKEGITAELEALKRAGIGGVEITPIYGVYGEEDKFIEYLSPQWVELLKHTLDEAARLGLGVDMATGTGWPFGGPWVSEGDACKNMNYAVYHLKGGERLRQAVLYHQQPYVRSVGTQIYETHGIHRVSGQQLQGTISEPAKRSNAKPITIDQLVEPVEKNPNLQALALDQVKFDKMLRPVVIMAYSDNGEVLNITDRLDANSRLDWTAPSGSWQVYAVFPGSHGKMVERAAPGGEGNVIDHFSAIALRRYLSRFDSAFKDTNLSKLRAFFNDSYEVDDARGAADWTPELFEEFLRRRGYDLREHLPALFGQASQEENERVLCDYRETISELVHDNFTTVWREWAATKGKIVRNQAHGSPANILDLYAAVDIPEMEGNDALRIKMASSAGHVSGKRLISSESATWLDEHFMSNLWEIKASVDLFMTSGINHVFYHGTCYSPQEDPWPGRLFYAAVHLNSRNPLWDDFAKLNHYVARCQAFLQNTSPANDVLLYFPIYDRFSSRGPEMVEHFDGVGAVYDSTAFKEAAIHMLERGYTYDYVSDRQIRDLRVDDGNLVSTGGTIYKTIVVPNCKYMPVSTLEALAKLAAAGGKVVLYKGVPQSYSGLKDRTEAFTTAKKQLTETSTTFQGDNLSALLEAAGVMREVMTDAGLTFIRKRDGQGFVYFITNWTGRDFDGTVRLSVPGRSAIIYDPVRGRVGKAEMVEGGSGLRFRLQIRNGEGVLVRTTPTTTRLASFPYIRITGDRTILDGPWQLIFVKGGPTLPERLTVSTLRSWTVMDIDGGDSFSGTARYSTVVEIPDSWEGNVLLELGTVKESARVLINGVAVDTLIGPNYTTVIDRQLFTGKDTLTVEVSNLMANRIADLDRRGVFWKRFYNVNFPARLAENRRDGLFTAAHWTPIESGLLGPVSITPVERMSE
jgi:hypothetical protein